MQILSKHGEFNCLNSGEIDIKCIFINNYIFKLHLGNIPRSVRGLYNKL